MIAHIYDGNISGHFAVEVENAEEVADLFAAHSGAWYNWDGQGMALLSDPSALVYMVNPDDDPEASPDFVVDYFHGENRYAVSLA